MWHGVTGKVWSSWKILICALSIEHVGGKSVWNAAKFIVIYWVVCRESKAQSGRESQKTVTSSNRVTN